MTQGAFFQDLAVVMAIAGLASALFSRFNWPKVFGYILVGVLMNEYTWGGSFLVDVTSLATISQLGIVFLMFTMGLEFSTSDMKKIKDVTIPTALIDTIVMTWLGYTVGTKVFGWGTMPSLFLGAAICDSATTLLAKVIGEMGWSNRRFVKLAMGTSVCEDIVCIGLIALVTGVAQGSGMSLGAVGVSLGWLFVFLLATVVFGLAFVPRLLKSIAKRKDDEALLLAVLGMCFFVSWVAFKLEFSLALGAFLVGLIGASSEVKERLHGMVAPLRALFAAMFFVSIGLLVDPFACCRCWLPIFVLSLVVVFGKGLNCLLGGLVTGLSIKTSVQMAMSLAQVGEFAFMVALLYVGLVGDVSNSMFEVTIGTSLLTTFLNPFMIRASEPVGAWAESHCPRRLAQYFETYRAFLAKFKSVQAPEPRRKVRSALVELGVIGALEVALGAAAVLVAKHDWSRFSVWFERYDTYLFIVLLNVFMLAMLAPIVGIARTLAENLGLMLVGAGEAKWQQVARQFVWIFVFVAVFVAAFAESTMINTAVMPFENRWFEVAMFVFLVLLALFGWKFFHRAVARAKDRFEEALKTDERLANLGQMITVSVPEDGIRRLTVGPTSPAVGGTVVSLNIRAKTGASVVAVIRDGRETRNVGPEWVFCAGDVLVALGEPAQIAALGNLLEGSR